MAACQWAIWALKQAKRDGGSYLMGYYNYQRPHTFNRGLAPAIAEEKSYLVSSISWSLYFNVKEWMGERLRNKNSHLQLAL